MADSVEISFVDENDFLKEGKWYFLSPVRAPTHTAEVDPQSNKLCLHFEIMASYNVTVTKTK